MNKHILRNQFLQLDYPPDALRIISLTPADKSNLLADLSNRPPISTEFGDFHFRGGHRLWHSPEAMPRTYIPDGPLAITDVSDGVMLEAPTEAGTGIRKKIEIRLDSDQPTITLTHTLINDGLWAVDLAPWAITQFRLGGTAILPLPEGNVDAAGLLHNRQFSLWPYARIHDPRLTFTDRFILFKADALLPPFKIGYFNTHGWIAYWFEGTLFRKTFDIHTNVPHPDNNCNAEMYCNDQFVELESLAPLTKLSPGEAVQHVETWEVFDVLSSLPEDIQNLLINQ